MYDSMKLLACMNLVLTSRLIDLDVSMLHEFSCVNLCYFVWIHMNLCYFV